MKKSSILLRSIGVRPVGSLVRSIVGNFAGYEGAP
jgi:hypothetical protein